MKSLFIQDTTKWMVWTDGASRIFNIFDNDEKRDSKIPRGQPTIPCNIRKLNTDIFGHLKQIRQVFLYDTRGLSRCYHNFTKLYQFQQVYYNDFCNSHSTTMLPPPRTGQNIKSSWIYLHSSTTNFSNLSPYFLMLHIRRWIFWTKYCTLLFI